LASGGAITSGAVLTNILFSTFTNNQSTGYGGAIVFSNPSASFTFNLNGDYFNGNTALKQGGAVQSLVSLTSGQAAVQVSNCTFYQNRTTTTDQSGFGGGYYGIETIGTSASGANTFINDTFFKNSSDTGGGLYLSQNDSFPPAEDTVLTSLTVNQNQASVAGGGLYLDTAQMVQNQFLKVTNSIFDGNSVTKQGYTGPLDVSLANNFVKLDDAGYNLVGLTDAPLFMADGDITTNNPGLDTALASNGAKAGYPPTLALLKTSLGYEKGRQSLAGQPMPLGFDARGLQRQTGKISIGAEDPDAM
jgi:predicted outer membrane repeat protein